MLLNPAWAKSLNLMRPLVWLFNATLVIIFLAWVLIDGVMLLIKKLLTSFSRQERQLIMKKTSKFRPVLLTGLIAAILAIFTLPVKAGEDVSHIEARKLQAAGEILSFEKIAEIARKIKPGEILETELERSRKSGLYIYELEILDANGVVWELDINAKTGEMMKIEIDD
jgi:uncharacterized membrane protein YkoI